MELVWDIYYLLCGPGRWIVEIGPIYTERLLGATDKTYFLGLRFLKATTPFVVLFSSFLWSGLFCCVLVAGTLAFYLLHTSINCDCLVYSVSQSDHIKITCISGMKNRHGHWV